MSTKWDWRADAAEPLRRGHWIVAIRAVAVDGEWKGAEEHVADVYGLLSNVVAQRAAMFAAAPALVDFVDSLAQLNLDVGGCDEDRENLRRYVVDARQLLQRVRS